MKERVSWLDYGKCICMLMVIYSHTVIYSTGRINDFLLLMLPTRLLVFFFISGYLTKVEGFDFKKTITSIGKKLLFPYFLFTLIIYLPKHLAHGTDISLQNMLYEILGGFASWFVAALAVSKITLAVCLKYTKNLLTIGAVCLGLAVVGFLITEYARPAEISETVAPSFCACLTEEFMNTVQRVPSSTGAWANRPSLAKSATS